MWVKRVPERAKKINQHYNFGVMIGKNKKVMHI